MDDAENERVNAERAEARRQFIEIESQEARDHYIMLHGEAPKNTFSNNDNDGDEPPGLDDTTKEDATKRSRRHQLDGSTQKAAHPPSAPFELQWTPAIDKQLLQLGRTCLFDFAKVASGLGPVLRGVDADACRVRFAELKKRAKNKAAPPPKEGAGGDEGSGGTGSSADVPWNSSLDSLLCDIVRKNAFDFDKSTIAFVAHPKVKEHGSYRLDAAAARIRFAAVKKAQKLGSVEAGRWTPMLDEKLTELVKSCKFDFDQVAAIFKQTVGFVAADGHKSKAAEACRVRFAQLKKSQKAKASSPKVAAAPAVSAADAIAAATARMSGDAAPLSAATAAAVADITALESEGVEWTGDLDELVGMYVRQEKFDFEKVAARLQAEAKAGTVTAADVRVRYSWLKKNGKKAPAAPPAAKTVEWTAALDEKLQKQVRACSFDFEKVAASLSVSVDACRVRFAQLKKGRKTKAASPKAAAPTTAASASSAVPVDSAKGAYGVTWTLDWSAALDATLADAVKANAYDFAKAAEVVTAAYQSQGGKVVIETKECKARMVWIRKQQKEAEGPRGGGATALSAGMFSDFSKEQPVDPTKELPPARHLSWDELQAHAFANSKLTFAPPTLPSIGDVKSMMDEEGDDDDDDDDQPQVDDSAEAELKPIRAKILSREEIWKEISTSGGLQNSVIADMD
jgi:hypothetical protein